MMAHFASRNSHLLATVLCHWLTFPRGSNLQRHVDDEIRSAAVWTIVNLTHFDRTAVGRRRMRRPAEIVSKLQVLGVVEALKELVNDPSEDVRERVREGLECLR